MRVAALLLAFTLLFITGCEEALPEISKKLLKESESVKEGIGFSTIDQTVLYQNDVTITAMALNQGGFLGTKLVLLLENNTDRDLLVQTRNESINGYMVDAIMSQDLTAGNKANANMTFLYDHSLYGIEEISEI
jgi:hypothetical protein